MSTSSINLLGSSIDVGSIVDSLIYVDSAPVRNMQSQVTTLQSKVSAFQSLNTKLSALSDKLNTVLFGDTEAPILKPYSFADRFADSVFTQCKVTSSNENTISATASNATVGGSYAITVTGLANAESMASANFSDISSTATGTGTITITSGSGDPITLTIGSSNATLLGVREAINNANAGVTATIIHDGSASPYRLLVTANDTGTANSFTITDNLTGGQALNMAQVQAASDAQFSVNGVSIIKSSNTVSDVINGVTFTLNAIAANPVTLQVGKDLDAIVEAINGFVSAYNEVNTYINSQFAYNSTTRKAGILSGDATLRSIQSTLQNQVIQSISNRFTSYRVANQVGLKFNRDGSLSLDETQIRSALSSNLSAVAALFLGDGTPLGGMTASDSRVACDGKTSATQAGTYAVQVNSLAQRATVTGTQQVTSLTGPETLTISLGSASAVVSLASLDSLPTVLSKINAALSAQGMALAATNDGSDRIQITANGYGSSQTVTVVSTSDGTSGTSGFGQTPVVASGSDIAGSIGGNAATGNGLILTGASGRPEEGLSLTIAQTTTGSYGSVTVAAATRGVEGAGILTNLQGILDGITDPLSGPVHHSTDSLNQNIKALNDQISAYQDRLEIQRELYTAQFSRADEALRLLTVAQSSLSSQLSKLG